MNKKYLIPCLILLAIAITSVWTYQKYNQFIPTANAAIHVQNLSEQEIQRLRQNTPITEVKVYKSDRIVKLMHHDQDIRTYPMRLGFDPIGHKVKEGDGKTPEGRYILDWRNPNSAFYKSLHVSYPNQQDKSKANCFSTCERVSPGGDIMIHGSATRSQVEKLPSLMTYLPRNDWTWGCIAVRNIDMDEIWKLVDDGTVISIYS